MSMIPDPTKRGQTPYDDLGLEPNAKRNEIATAYARARRDRSKDSQTVSQAHEQLTRVASRLRVDFLFYDAPDIPAQVSSALPAVDLSTLRCPLPVVPVTELLDISALLDMLSMPPLESPEAGPSETIMEPALSMRFDR